MVNIIQNDGKFTNEIIVKSAIKALDNKTQAPGESKSNSWDNF